MTSMRRWLFSSPLFAWLTIAIVATAGCRRAASDAVGTADKATGSPSSSHVKPDIILISIDSLRADHVGCYGYERDTTPTIDRLAREGVRIENAVSTTSWTLPAHAAMFTGLYDSAHGVVDVRQSLASRHLTLAELLRDAGYQTAGFFGGPFLHPLFGLDQGFSTYLSCMTTIPDDAAEAVVREAVQVTSHRDVTGPRTAKRFSAWLPSADDRPLFVFLHLWDVHYDYIPPQQYVDMFDPDYRGTVNAEQYNTNEMLRPDMPARDLAHIIALYDGEIRFTDDIIKQILDELDAAGRLEQALIVVTSDHGDEFFEHGRKGHQRSLFEEVVRVPLIFRWPGHIDSGNAISDQVRLIDVLPTILSLAGVRQSVAVQGRDVSPLLTGRSLPAQPALLELLCLGLRLRALRTNDYKLIVSGSGRPTALFHLSKDPTEKKNLAFLYGQMNPKVKTMLAELRSVMHETESWTDRPDFRAVEPAEVDKAMMRRLRSLGYLGDDNTDDSQEVDGSD